MHVPWGWIKQRPHFIAEELSKYFSVFIANKKASKPGANKNLPTSVSPLLNYLTYFLVPLYNPIKRRIIICDLINWVLIRFLINPHKYKYFWITSLRYFAIFKPFISNDHLLIYDCMDDELSFPGTADNQRIINRYKKLEKELVSRANHVIFSANNLRDVVINRTASSFNNMIVNNATCYPDYDECVKIKSNNSSVFRSTTKSLVYIGTIAEWFDFDSILKLLDSSDNLEIYLIGPVDCQYLNHPKIHFMGPCKHDEVWTYMLNADVLIMPFKISPLILSVNPVKLYEYIWARKPIISIRYPETEKFSNYVYLYDNYYELIKQYKIIENNEFKPKCQDITKVEKFIQSNTWASRVSAIMENNVFRK